jgi:hypothetical protein
MECEELHLSSLWPYLKISNYPKNFTSSVILVLFLAFFSKLTPNPEQKFSLSNTIKTVNYFIVTMKPLRRLPRTSTTKVDVVGFSPETLARWRLTVLSRSLTGRKIW